MSKLASPNIILVIIFSMMPTALVALTESEITCIDSQYSHFLHMQDMHGGGLNNMSEGANNRFKADAMETCSIKTVPEKQFQSIYLEIMDESGYEVKAADNRQPERGEQELTEPKELAVENRKTEEKSDSLGVEASSYDSVEEYREAYTIKILKQFPRFPRWKQEGIAIATKEPSSLGITITGNKNAKITLYEAYFSRRLNNREETAKDPLNIGLRWHLTKKLQNIIPKGHPYCFLNTKQMFLLVRGRNVTVSSNEDNDCKIESGVWEDYFTGKPINVGDVDVDYAVPLEDAWSSGAEDFHFTRKVRYANPAFLELPQHTYLRAKTARNKLVRIGYRASLVVASKDSIKERGGANIVDWLPDDKYIACYFINDYVAVKMLHNLSFSSEEIDVIESWKDEDVTSSEGRKKECFLPVAYVKNKIFPDSLRDTIQVRD